MIKAWIASLVAALIFAIFNSVLSIGNDAIFIFVMYFIYSLPVFIVGGTIASYVVNKWFNGYFIKLVIYSLSGVIFNVFIYVAIINNYPINDIFYYLILGVLAAVIYYHVLIIATIKG
ncbi:hypothetical protein B0H94_11164 [Salsuginibacillus halophilus]|uniref:Uncharacterized protein n=1 Tax=Salsuginibacillus halophilus TaxID=517424 RepID=A0A2P8HAL3_9BACI|nr:hypothetical protein [Salsuginibacillus halophilus]PSL43240.1 hypothetical protein B0H94_11164 [Salsuginibacillus halophilus]